MARVKKDIRFVILWNQFLFKIRLTQVEVVLKKDWLGKPLVLQLDHINGVFNDNRIENLRLVCPNCHSQFTTFAGKNKPRTKKAKQYETNENRLVRIELTRKFNPTKKELTELISKLSLVKVGKYFGVSDNAIRKRCKILGVDWKK